MAAALLRKHRPIVVAVTGSVGKSSTKEAIALALAPHFRVRKSEGNYNNEFGIPLTILGEKTGGRSPLSWGLIILRFVFRFAFGRRYPQVLVLEMGIDRPGDMDYLVSFVPVHIGVATAVSGSHLEHFGSLQAIFREKRKLIEAIPEDGFAVLSADDERVLSMAERTKGRVITYGFAETAALRAEHLLFQGDARRAEGYSLKLSYQGKSIPLRLPGVVARHHIPAVLAAAAVASALKLNLVDVVGALEAYRPLPGRLNLLPGRNDSVLLDDTYNASPASARAALAVLGEMSAPRKVAVLGDMLELGPDAASQHAQLADDLKEANVTFVALVGVYGRALYDALLEAGYARKQLLWFSDPRAAAETLASQIRPDDLVLIKGSQGLRMEIVTEALLRDPDIAAERLCRQSPAWKAIPFTPPAEWQGADLAA